MKLIIFFFIIQEAFSEIVPDTTHTTQRLIGRLNTTTASSILDAKKYTSYRTSTEGLENRIVENEEIVNGTARYQEETSQSTKTTFPIQNRRQPIKSRSTTVFGVSTTISNFQPSLKAGNLNINTTKIPTTIDYQKSDSSLNFKPLYNCSNVKDDLNGDLSYCCSFPRLSVPTEVYFDCQNYCDKLQKWDDKCCMMSCCFNRTGIIVDKIFNVEYLRQSLTYFVFGDLVWSEIINESIDFCYNRAVSQNYMKNNTLDCNAIPHHAYRIIDCVYARNYINCPEIDWNINDLDFCDGTEKYVETCLEWP